MIYKELQNSERIYKDAIVTLMEHQLDKIPGYDSLDSNSMDVYLNLVKQGVKQHILELEKKEGKDVNLDAINIDSV